MTVAMQDNEKSGSERRQYIRLDTVFPVEFRLLASESDQPLSGWMQGFTNNVSKGGLCLAVNKFSPELAALVRERQVRLSLGIEMPFSTRPIAARATVVWVEQVEAVPGKYLIGLHYEDIEPRSAVRIMRYARAKKLFVPLILSLILILGLGFVAGSYLNVRLIHGNKALVEQLVKILQESSVAKQKIKEIGKEREDLQIKIQALQLRIGTVEEEKARLEEKAKNAEVSSQRRFSELNAIIDGLMQEKVQMQEDLISVQHKESVIAEELLRLDKRKASLEKANLDKMYQWLKSRQQARTGLVLVSEGNGLPEHSFVYEQALAVEAFTTFSDFERARRILEFFSHKAKKNNGLFFSVYSASDGRPLTQVVASGPNIWLGIAILHYTAQTKDRTYLGLAGSIAEMLIALQNANPEGGLRCAVQMDSCLLEDNLEASVFFDMFHRLNNAPAYRIAADRAFQWCLAHAAQPVALFGRGVFGGSALSSGSFFWSIVAFGPATLEAAGLNPERFIEDLEIRCAVETPFTRPGGQRIMVRGFDCLLDKDRVVLPELTAQAVLAYRILANHYYAKGLIAKYRAYLVKADEYLAQLSNMVISSASPSGQAESCLPFATQDDADTGHGWRTLAAGSTGSIAATIYTLFAYYDHNPLER